VTWTSTGLLFLKGEEEETLLMILTKYNLTEKQSDNM